MPININQNQTLADERKDTKPAVLVNAHVGVPEGTTIIDIPRPDEIINGDPPMLLE